MRIRISATFAAVGLALAGCTSAGQKQAATDAPSRPFTGAALTRPVGRDAAPPPEVDSLLAGEVLDKAFNKRVPAASIQVVDLQDPNPAPAARLDVSANADGYFFIPGLQRGHHYQLIARVKDSDHLLSGSTLAMPPNPRILIYLSEDYTTPTTPAPLGPPTPPDRSAGPPSAALDPPTKARQDGDPGAAAPPPPLNKTKIAERDGDAEPGGFQKAPTAAIPGPSPIPVIPPPPPVFQSSPPAAPPAPPAPPVEQTGHDGPPQRNAPPFCVLVGNRLDNFALTGLDGQPWEFRRDPPRRLVLIDFWKSNCPPCLAAISHLRGLQDKYGRDGLEVVGIAYEDRGPPAEQLQKVRNARSVFHINYTVLLGGDSAAGPCPVRSQFLVDSFPRLVLLDETGEILWRSSPEGLSEQQYKELEMEIWRKFHPPSR